MLPVQLQHDDPHAAGGEDSRTPVKNKVTAHRSVMGPLHNSSVASSLSRKMMIKSDCMLSEGNNAMQIT